MPSLLTLNADDCAIGDFLVGLPVQRPPDRNTPRLVVSNDLNAANGLAPRPLSNGLQALFSESTIAQSDCFEFRHAAYRLSVPVSLPSNATAQNDKGG